MNLWNNNINPHQGFNDQELKNLVDINYIIKIDKSLGCKTIIKLFWTSELYSFGKCFREQLNWPNWLPLPFYSDHGVCLLSSFQSHEKNNKSLYHLTWAYPRYKCLSKYNNKNVIRTIYPWITYRRNKKYSIKDDAKGTIIFYAHSNNGIDIQEFNDDEYIKTLKSLPEKYHPLVICLHQHDINKGIHLKLRKYNIPIITMGYTYSPYFVDRFYEIVSHFKNATSSSGGSELFTTTEFGLNYFIIGQPPTYINRSNKENEIGIMDRKYDSTFIELSNMKKDIFLYGNNNINDKKIFCEEMLGLDGIDVVKLTSMRKVFFKELIRLFPFYIKIVISHLINKLKFKFIKRKNDY